MRDVNPWDLWSYRYGRISFGLVDTNDCEIMAKTPLHEGTAKGSCGCMTANYGIENLNEDEKRFHYFLCKEVYNCPLLDLIFSL